MRYERPAESVKRPGRQRYRGGPSSPIFISWTGKYTFLIAGFTRMMISALKTVFTGPMVNVRRIDIPAGRFAGRDERCARDIIPAGEMILCAGAQGLIGPKTPSNITATARRPLRMGNMKKIFFLAILVAMQASTAFTDEVEQGLLGGASDQIKASARQVIRAGVDGSSVIDVTHVMLQNDFKGEQVLRAHEIMTTMHRAGLPLQPVVNKLFEGIAKHVAPANILNAMDAVRSRYEFSFSRAGLLTTRTDQKDQLGLALAAGLAAGLSFEDADGIVRAVLDSRAGSTSSDQANALALEAFETARDAARLGVSSDAAAGLVNQALNKGFSLAEMQAMHQSFSSQSQHAVPENLARSYAAAIQQGVSFQGQGAVTGGMPGTPGGSPGHGGSGSSGSSGGSGGSGGGGAGGGSGGGGGGSGGGGGPGGGGSGGGGGAGGNR